VSRFPDRDHFAACNGTAPLEVSSGGRKAGRPVAARQPPPQPRNPHGRRHPDPLPAQRRPRLTTTRNWPRARPAKKPCARWNARPATPSSPVSRLTPGAPQPSRRRAREGNRGTTLQPGRPAHTPNAGTSGKPLPGLPPTLRPQPAQTLLLPSPLHCYPARADGSRTGRSPAAQRRPQGVLDAAAREPIMPRGPGKEAALPLILKQRGVCRQRAIEDQRSDASHHLPLWQQPRLTPICRFPHGPVYL
jgi:hypothetical protein